MFLENPPRQNHAGIKRQVTVSWFNMRQVFKNYFENKTVPPTFNQAQKRALLSLISIYQGVSLKSKTEKSIASAKELQPLTHRAYIQEIEIQNFKSIGHLKLSFAKGGEITNMETGTSTPWLMILGENGVGKKFRLTSCNVCPVR